MAAIGRLLILAILMAISVWFVLFLPDPPAPGDVDPRQVAALQQAYRLAVQDAAVAEADEIYPYLTAITPQNPSLHWHPAGEPRRLLVTTWAYSSQYPEAGSKLNLEGEAWVTVAPELQDFCRRQSSNSRLTLRLEQLLGLPPDNGKQVFVELWVQPSDMFRPSADPEITDHEAELELRHNPAQLTTNPDHEAWFEALKARSYEGEHPYPWTRLGYSYDWGNPASDVGLSEFVVRPGSPVEVHTVSTLDSYCRP